MNKKLLIVFGTRPEAIKMAPLIRELYKFPEYFNVSVCVTAQHREMLDQVLKIFNIVPDFDLDIMEQGQDLNKVAIRVLSGMNQVLESSKPDMVFIQGDTLTSTITALAAFFKKIPVAHVEAGLRTNNIYSPWPEEMNRQLSARLASWHFAPTTMAARNLLNENIEKSRIIITGNTVIDALKDVVNHLDAHPGELNTIKQDLLEQGFDISRTVSRRLILVTGHRRENFGEGIKNICKAILNLSERYPDVDFLYPVHRNPNVTEPVGKILGNSQKSNVFLIGPVDYLTFTFLMSRCYLILTDSGGIQEEAPGLGKPVLVMRDVTERPEAVEAGTARLVGTKTDKIVGETSLLLDYPDEYRKMAVATNPFGDGTAAEKIVGFLIKEIKNI